MARFRFILFAVIFQVFFGLQSPVSAQSDKSSEKSAARVAFDKEILLFSKQFNRTVILEDIPDGIAQADTNFDPNTDFKKFLNHYQMKSLESPGVILLYRKVNANNTVASVTMAEAALALEDSSRLLARSVTTRQNKDIFSGAMLHLLRGLSSEQLLRAQKDGLDVREIDKNHQQDVRDLANYNFIDSHVYRIHEAQNRLNILLSKDTQVIGELNSENFVCRLVAPNKDRSVSCIIGEGSNYFINENTSPDSFLIGKHIFLGSHYTQDNPQTIEGTIGTVFQALSKRSAGDYKRLFVEDSLANKPLYLYSVGSTTAIRLCRAVALLYNLRVQESDDKSGGKITLIRHKARAISNAGELKAELLRVLPAPLLRLLTEPEISENQSSSGPLLSTENFNDQSSQERRYTQSIADFTDKLDFMTRSVATKKMKELVKSSLVENQTRQGYASLIKSPGIYDVLTANVLLAEALPEIAFYLREPPAFISNLSNGKLHVKVKVEEGKETVTLTVNAAYVDNPTRSSTMGFTLYDVPGDLKIPVSD